MTEKPKEFNESLLESRINVTYKGNVSFDLIDSTFSLIYRQLEEEEPDIALRKRVFVVVVEILQNVCHNVEQLKNENLKTNYYDISNAKFIIKSDENYYYISTSNFVSNNSIPTLNEWLEKIAHCNEEELKNLYRSILKNRKTDQKHAGIGLVYIARKVKNKFNYDFIKVDNYFSIFNFNVKVEK